MVLVKCDHDFAVRVGAARVGEVVYEALADAVVVVKLAVDDGVDAVVGGAEGFMAGRREVLDGEAAMCEAYSSGGRISLAIAVLGKGVGWSLAEEVKCLQAYLD